MRILHGLEMRPFEEVATEVIEQELKALLPVDSKKESKLAYDLVDRDEQMKLPEGKRNPDVWWDSNILFRDQRYIFKRVLDLGPEIDPWLVPQSQKLGCPLEEDPALLEIPENAHTGLSFYNYYKFTITPDQAMFCGKKGQLVHQPFKEFNTADYQKIMSIVAAEMEQLLHEGFDKRDCCDPVLAYKNLRRVGLAYVISRDDSK
jgi:hypothetical protein